MFLRAPGNGIGTKINNECASRGEVIFVACLIGIRDCMKHEWRVIVKNNIMVQSTIEIEKQPLNNTPLLNGWLVHELRQLTNRISNVRASKRQVLKMSHHSAVLVLGTIKLKNNSNQINSRIFTKAFFHLCRQMTIIIDSF